MNKNLFVATLAAAGALSIAPLRAETINACVDSQNGLLRVVAPGTACMPNQYALGPPNWKVAGGGGITGRAGAGLQQSLPISDNTGLIAWGGNAIGWQAAADDWGFVQAFVVCVAP